MAVAAKEGSCAAPSLVPSTQPFGGPLPCCGFGAWNLLGPNPNPNPTLNRDPPLKPKPASIPTPAFERPSGMGPHFSPRGDHENGGASTLPTFLGQTQP